MKNIDVNNKLENTDFHLSQVEINHLFIDAISYNDLALAKNYLIAPCYQINAQINCHNGDALIWAMKRDNTEMLDYFLKSDELKERANMDGPFFHTLFKEAMGHGSMEIMDYLVSTFINSQVEEFVAKGCEGYESGWNAYVDRAYRCSIHFNRLDKMIRFLSASDLKINANLAEGDYWGFKQAVHKEGWDMVEYLIMSYDIDIHKLGKMAASGLFVDEIPIEKLEKLQDFQTIKKEKKMLEMGLSAINASSSKELSNNEKMKI